MIYNPPFHNLIVGKHFGIQRKCSDQLLHFFYLFFYLLTIPWIYWMWSPLLVQQVQLPTCSNCAKHTVKSRGCWSAYNTQWRPAADCQSCVSGSSAYCRMLRPCNPPQTIVDVRIEGRLSPVGLLLPCARAFKCTEGKLRFATRLNWRFICIRCQLWKAFSAAY